MPTDLRVHRRAAGAARMLGLLAVLGALACAPALRAARAADLSPVPASPAHVSAGQRQAIEGIIHDYLLNHPDVLIAALQSAEEKMKSDSQAQAKQALVAHHKLVFDDPATPVGGNPHGSVSMVEFFDYRCPYCKQMQPGVEGLLRQDPQLRLVYKELPVLGPVSLVAARAALAAREQGKYDAFHDAMMNTRGQITDATVFDVARSVGLDVARLKTDMAAPAIDQQIKANLALADTLGIQGTPAFIVGDEVVPGAVDVANLKQLIAANTPPAGATSAGAK
jgi:protein-disulfide isomerase